MNCFLQNKSVLHKLKYLQNVDDHKLTVVAQHLKLLGPETFIATGAQTVPNFLNIRTK